MYGQDPWNVQVLGIGVNGLTPSEIRSWKRVHNLSFPLLVDTPGLWNAYNNDGYFQVTVVLDQCRIVRWIEEYSYSQGDVISTILDAYEDGPIGDSCESRTETAFPDLIYSSTGCIGMNDRYTSESVDTDGPDRVFEFTLTETTSVDVTFDGFMGAAVYVRSNCNFAGSEIGYVEADMNGDATLELGDRSAGNYYVIVDGVGENNKGSFKMRIKVHGTEGGGGGGGGGGCSTAEGAHRGGAASLLILLLMPAAFAWTLRRRIESQSSTMRVPKSSRTDGIAWRSR